ncbi:DUF11 domain-containing protein [bacterium]|nr:DUF11 domain-containing protein [bacterium]
MNKSHAKIRALLALPVLAALLAGGAALAADGLVLEAFAEIEVVQEGADGARTVARVPAETVVPGDEVIYTLTWDNRGGEPADDVAITNPIPEHMELRRADGTPAHVEIMYSVDGGAIFGPLSDLTIPDGAGGIRPAVPADCTHIRWHFHRPLAPGESGQVSYTTRLM